MELFIYDRFTKEEVEDAQARWAAAEARAQAALGAYVRCALAEEGGGGGGGRSRGVVELLSLLLPSSSY